MHYKDFVRDVMQAGRSTSFEKAAEIVAACLETLGENMPRSERDNLAAQLPKELKALLSRREFKHRAALEDFYSEIGARADIGYPEAVRQARAVMQTLRRAISPEQLEKMRAALPSQYGELFEQKPSDPLSPTAEGISKARPKPAPVTERASERDVFELFKAESVKVLRALKKLQATSAHQSAEREAQLAKARMRVLFLNRLEGERLYPFFELLPQGREERDRSAREKKSIEDRLSELQETPRNDPRFGHFVEALIGEVTEHVERAQREVYPRLRKLIPPEEARLLAENIKREMGLRQ